MDKQSIMGNGCSQPGCTQGTKGLSFTLPQSPTFLHTHFVHSVQCREIKHETEITIFKGENNHGIFAVYTVVPVACLFSQHLALIGCVKCVECVGYPFIIQPISSRG